MQVELQRVIVLKPEVGVATGFCRSSNLETAPMLDETIVYDADAKQFCMLNETAASMWGLLENPCTVDKLVAHLTEKFSGTQDKDVLAEVRTALEELQALNMVEEIELNQNK